MWPNTKLTESLRIRYPVIQAGMAGGITTPELVAAVSNAGGLGTLGAGYMPPDQIRDAVRNIRAQTSQAFAVNLFIPQNVEQTQAEITSMMEYLIPYRKLLELEDGPFSEHRMEAFEDQVQVLVDEGVQVFSFTFGVPNIHMVQELKNRNITLIGTATTVREAEFLESRGIDLIVAQGHEAGGHRGTFLDRPGDAMVGSMALIPQIVDKVDVPVIAAGGIMDGRGVLASLALGAVGVQMGSAFLTCIESGANHKYKEELVHSTDTSTVVTTAFSGKPARGIRNRFITDLDDYSKDVPPYPIQHFLTREIRAAAAKRNLTDYMSLWAGQSAGMGTIRKAADILEDISQYVAQTLSQVHPI